MQELLEAIAYPVLSLKRADARVFAPFLLGALLMATGVWWLKLRRRLSLFRFLFPGKIWLHDSALFDLRFMVVRGLLSTFVLLPLVFETSLVAVFFKTQLSQALPGPNLELPKFIGLALVTGAAFIGEDLCRYLMHRLAHRVPALWELHKVHHSAEVLTPFTVYRTHPVEGILMRAAASFGLASGAAISSWFLGASLSVWLLLGVHGLSVLWNLTGSNLRHSHVYLSYPKWLQPLLVSPAAHQIHHSKDPAHYDKNFGSVFGIWDFLGGTLLRTAERERLVFGLSPEQKNHKNTVLSALFLPILASIRSILRRKENAL